VSFIHSLMGDLAEGERRGIESLDGNRRVGNRRDEAFAHNAVGQARMHLGRLGDAIAGLDDAVAVSSGLQSPRLLFGNILFRSLTLFEIGAYDLASRDVLHSLELNRDLGGTFFLPILQAADGARLALDGRLDDARERFAESGGSTVLLHRVQRAYMGLLAWESVADPDGMEEFARELSVLPAEETRLFSSWGAYGLAYTATLRGDHASALGLLEPALAFAEAADNRILAWRLHRLAAMARAGLGNGDGAAEARRRSVEALRPVVDSLPPGELHEAFTARRDVAEVLAWGSVPR
jgi:tetratricopeptide (TPR) repeat protein